MSAPYNVNPMQIIQMIKGGANPQQLLMQIMRQSPISNTPVGANILQLLAEGRTQDIEKIVRNLTLNPREQILIKNFQLSDNLWGFKLNKFFKGGHKYVQQLKRLHTF